MQQPYRGKLIITIGILFIILGSTALFSQENNTAAANYLDVYNQLMALPEAPAQQVATVNNIKLKRDVAEFDLIEGSIQLLAPVANRPAAMVFQGSGRFSFTPPTVIEQDQLARFYKETALNTPFNLLVLIFADSTYDELQKKAGFAAAGDHGLKAELKEALKYLSDDDAQYFDTHIMKSFLEGAENGLFYAHIQEDKDQPLFFKIDPYEVEEIRLLRRAETSRFFNIPEVVCQFHRKIDYRYNLNIPAETKDKLHISHYKIDATIEGNLGLDFSATSEIDFHALADDQQWLHFNLFYLLDVDEILWDDGTPAVFFKGKENPDLWVRSEKSLTKKEPRKLTFKYHGKLMMRDRQARIYILSSSNWYPVHSFRVPATFDLTYHTPHKFPVFVSVGEKLSFEKRPDYYTSRWQVKQPANFASFNLADYKSYKVKDDRTPPTHVMSYKKSRNEKDVGGDVVNSMALFNEMFGDYPVANFYVTETPFGHGLAFPGLIHLAASTFQRTGDRGYHEIFRGHEVAHQWFGIGVDYATYHDKWLSEGLCSFAGLKYMQTVLQKKKGTEKYFDVLNEWRKQILDNRKYLFGSGQEAGPISLGYRTSSSSTAGDYDLIIYLKGAWVFHMLRMMMIDVKDLNNEKPFADMMRDYYQSFKGKKASTADFRKIVEKHTRMDLGWFFDQWIDGTAVPDYKWGFSSEPSGGKYTIKVSVEQQNVPEDFQALMLFKVDFGAQGSYVARKLVRGPQSTITLVKAPFPAKNVEFNYLESVLCKADRR